MRQFLRQVGSVVFWAFVGLSSALLFPVAVLIWAVTSPFDRRRRALHEFTCFWASLYTWLNPAWPVHVRGREHIEPGRTYVLVANHLSLLDILVLFRLFKHFKWVAKVEVFKVPVIGWNMRLNEYIPLKRGNRESVVEMMATAEATLRSGSSLMIFPEGTRSVTGELKEFKLGAFELAARTGVPLLPIVIEGTHDALPKHGFVLRGRHRIRVTVLPAVPEADVADLTPAQAAQHVRRIIAAQLAADPRPTNG